MEILNKINWVDILILVVFVRALYIGIITGFGVEAFKLAGVIFSVFVTLHYFGGISRLLQDKIHIPEGSADLFSYAVLWGLVALAFKFIREGIMLLVKIQTQSVLDTWGGAVFALIRGLLISSLTVLFLRVTAVDYLKKNSENSLTAAQVVWMAPKLYESMYNGFISKFFPTEEFSKSAFKFINTQ